MISLDLSHLSSDPMHSADQNEAKIIYDFLERILASDIPFAHEPLSWIWIESYLNGEENYSLEDALTYSQFPLLTRPILLKELAKAVGGERPDKVSATEWTQYIVDYAKDHYGESAAKAVRAYIELCIVSRIGSDLRCLHEGNLMARIHCDSRLLEEIRSGIKHFVPAEAPHRNPNVALKLLEPNGYDMARGHARISPLIHTTRRSQPDLESPIIHARDHRKRKSYANKMVTPVHRYKYPMPKLKFEGLTSRTRYSRLFRFLSGAALPTKSCWPESILSKHIAA